MDTTETFIQSAEEELRRENEELRARNRELLETIDAIRLGQVDAIVVAEGHRQQVYSLEGADRPYRVLVETIQEGALTLTPAGTILYANAAFAGMRDLPLSAVFGTALRDHVAPRDRAQFDALLEASLRGACRGEMSLCSRTASFPVQVSLTPVLEHGGTTISVVVTDRRQDYDRLRLLARMLDSVVDAVSAVDPQGTVIYWNDAAERLYGWTASEMIGSPLIATFDPAVPEAYAWRSFDQLLAGETWSGEYLARHRDGRRFPVLATRAPVYDEDGTVIAVIGTSHDITDRKRSETALQKRNEELASADEELRCQNEELLTIQEEVRLRNDDLIEAQRHLQESEAQLRAATALATRERDQVRNLLAIAGVMILALDAEGRVTLINRRGCEILGYSEEEILGRHWAGTFVPEAIRGDLRADLESVIAGQTGDFQRNENPVVTRAGTERHILWSNRPITGDGGRIVGILSSGEDITERKRAEEALQESERRNTFLLALGDSLRELEDPPEIAAVASEMVGRHLGVDGVAYSEIDPSGRHPTVRAYWTESAAPIGADLTGMEDLGIGDLYPHGAARVRASFGVPIWRGGKLAAMLAVRSTQPRAWTENEADLLRDAGGRVWAAIERARAEVALRESEARFRSVIENSRDVVYRVNLPTGRYEYVSPSCKAIVGYTAEEMVALDREALLSIVHPDDLPVMRSMLERVEETGTCEAEYRQRAKNGEYRWLSNNVSLIRDDAGRPLYRTGTLRDITERKEAELALARSAGELRRSNEELQRFAYVASHDLQEPLRSIVSFSQLLDRRYRGKLDADADEYIGFIVEGGTRMQTLIQDLLQVSRVETQAKPLAPTDAAAVVADAMRSLETPLREAGATVEVGALPAVMADAAQLEQVFANLIGNAVKYRREGIPSVVAISATRANGMVEFAVRDNGIGIEAEYFDRIFEMFRRLHTHDKYEGTGIGLAVVKRIVERHGGTVRVESTPGEGSTFSFTLPAA